MQNYVWGILVSLFILDIVKLKYQDSFKKISTNDTEDEPTPPIQSGIEIKSSDGTVIKVELEGEKNPEMHQMKILYCTS